MTDQIRRSSRSVCANLTEAWFRRRYPKYFISELNDAGTEASETMVWLDFAVECRYLQKPAIDPLYADYRFIVGGITKMMDQPEKWCISTKYPPPFFNSSLSSIRLCPLLPNSLLAPKPRRQ